MWRCLLDVTWYIIEVFVLCIENQNSPTHVNRMRHGATDQTDASSGGSRNRMQWDDDPSSSALLVTMHYRSISDQWSVLLFKNVYPTPSIVTFHYFMYVNISCIVYIYIYPLYFNVMYLLI